MNQVFKLETKPFIWFFFQAIEERCCGVFTEKGYYHTFITV